MSSQQQEPECCPPFETGPWDGTTHTWDQKKFIKDKVVTIFHIPLNFGGAMRRLNSKVQAAGAGMPDYLCLSDHTSKWNMDLYLAVDKEVPGAENITLSGKYISKVYEGPFKDSGKWMQDFSKFTQEKALKTGRQFTWYTTCPKCAKKYGKNYVVNVAEVIQG